LVLDDFGRLGLAWRETDVERTDFETVTTDLLHGKYSNPVRVVVFNAAEGWSRDVSEDVRASCASGARTRSTSCRSSWKAWSSGS
jgi:hypothetical protein